jgi:hypothetical protein
VEDEMKKVAGIVAIAFTLITGAALAQQTTPSPESGSRHHMPMQDGMCPMMGGMSGGMMSGGMMSGGMMMGAQSDSPRMVQMRGEMLKAMGEIMMKYGKMMETGK